MVRRQPDRIIIIGAGAAGLMAARELGRAGKKVRVLEARDRCGGRIQPLSSAEFGYPAEGGAEFVHGEAPVTRSVLGEAGLSLLPVQGVRWSVDRGVFSRDEMPDHNTDRFYACLSKLKTETTVADFLKRHFAGPEYSRLRHLVERMVEGYDAADPTKASMLALREEWMDSSRSKQARIVGGYGAMISFLVAECRAQGATIHLDAPVKAIETTDDGILVHCTKGDTHAGDAAILTVPLPVLQDVVLPPRVREQTAMAAKIGFGNVIKLLLHFKHRWWTEEKGKDLSDLSFLLSNETIPVWWTQHPSERPVLTGWLAGPRTERMIHFDETELVERGLGSLASLFGRDSKLLKADLVAGRAINWAHDPFAGGAYSYATPETRRAQSKLAIPEQGVFLSGEALYRGRDMGTVEAALASGRETARTVLGTD